jgi:hypothetical protein
MKAILILFLCSFAGILPVISGSEENLEISSSDVHVMYSSMRYHKIIGHDVNGYYVWKFQQNRHKIEKLDKNLNPVKEEFIKLNEKLRTYEFEDVIHFHDRLYVFMSRRGFRNNVLYYQEIDKKTLQATTAPVVITDVQNMLGNWADFHFKLSRKENKLLIVSRQKIHLSKVQFNEFYIFDKDLELVWEHKDSYDYEKQGPRYNEYTIDERGNIAILSFIKRATIFDLKKPVKNVYSIYRYTDNGENFKKYTIALDHKYIRGIQLVAGNNGELICAGLYSELFRKGIRGTFFLEIDNQSGEFINAGMQEFDGAFLEKMTNKNESLIADEELIGYGVTDLVVRNNGTYTMIAEQFYNQTYNTYNNLLVFNFHPDGLLNWKTIIEKKQDYSIHTRYKDMEPEDIREFLVNSGAIGDYNTNYCSYALLAPVDESKMFLVYNESIKNITKKKKKYYNFNNPKKSYVAVVEITENGQVNKKTVLPWKRKALFPKPLHYYEQKTDELIIPAYRNRKYKFYKFNFNV